MVSDNARRVAGAFHEIGACSTQGPTTGDAPMTQKSLDSVTQFDNVNCDYSRQIVYFRDWDAMKKVVVIALTALALVAGFAAVAPVETHPAFACSTGC